MRTIGEVVRCPSPVNVQRTEELLELMAVRVPRLLKYPVCAVIAGGTKARKLPVSLPLDALNMRLLGTPESAETE